MSELVKKIYDLAKQTSHSPAFMMAQYVVQYELIEKQHESCYGMMASMRSKQPNYCMQCIGERALYALIEEYKPQEKEKDV